MARWSINAVKKFSIWCRNSVSTRGKFSTLISKYRRLLSWFLSNSWLERMLWLVLETPAGSIAKAFKWSTSSSHSRKNLPNGIEKWTRPAKPKEGYMSAPICEGEKCGVEIALLYSSMEHRVLVNAHYSRRWRFGDESMCKGNVLEAFMGPRVMVHRALWRGEVMWVAGTEQ